MRFLTRAILLMTLGFTGCGARDADRPSDDAGGGSCTTQVPATCGDGSCRNDQGETPRNCRADCVPSTCGDGSCRSADGETAHNCPEDCVPSTCGNGTCDPLETTQNCSRDCGDPCIRDPERPVYCEVDGHCYRPGATCMFPLHSCGGQMLRCVDETTVWSCCDGIFMQCPPEKPYFCPGSFHGCVGTAGECPGGGCEIWAKPCGTPSSCDP